MRLSDLTLVAISLGAGSIVTATSGRITARDNVTDNVLQITVHDSLSKTSSLSSEYLLRRRINPLRKRQGIPFTEEDLVSHLGASYMAEVIINGQRFALEIDTGSYQTWAATTKFRCLDVDTKADVEQSACGLGPLFDPAAPFRSTDQACRIRYLSNEVLNGYLKNVPFGFGGVRRGQEPYVTIDQEIGAMTSGTWHGNGISSGVLGLAYPSAPMLWEYLVQDYQSVLFTLFHTKDITPVFSLALQRLTTSAPTAGHLAFGGIPNVRTDGHWVQTPLVPNAQGRYTLYHIVIDGFDIKPASGLFSRLWKKKQKYRKFKQTMIIDSGTTMLYLPDEVAKYIADSFEPPAHYSDSEGYVVPCDARSPRVGIRIAGTSYYISAQDLLGPRTEPSRDHVRGLCSLMIAPAGEDTPVLGATWLKNVLVVFDMSNAVKARRGVLNRDSNPFGYVRIAGRMKY